MRATVAAMAGLLCALVLAPAGSAHAQEPRRPRRTAPRPGDGGPGGSAHVPGMASRVEGDRTAPVTVDASATAVATCATTMWRSASRGVESGSRTHTAPRVPSARALSLAAFEDEITRAVRRHREAR